MLFCVSGWCEYVKAKDFETSRKLQTHRGTAHDMDDEVIANVDFNDVEPGMWVSEASLYTPWTHCGDLSACTEGLLLAVGADALAAVVKQYEQAFVDVVIYAQVFVA